VRTLPPPGPRRHAKPLHPRVIVYLGRPRFSLGVQVVHPGQPVTAGSGSPFNGWFHGGDENHGLAGKAERRPPVEAAHLDVRASGHPQDRGIPVSTVIDDAPWPPEPSTPRVWGALQFVRCSAHSG